MVTFTCVSACRVQIQEKWVIISILGLNCGHWRHYRDKISNINHYKRKGIHKWTEKEIVYMFSMYLCSLWGGGGGANVMLYAVKVLDE
jgi:hypothetical protein